MAPPVKLPGILRLLGKKHVELATQWLPSAVTFGATGAIAVTWATDWKLILQYVPYYNGKFPQEETTS